MALHYVYHPTHGPLCVPTEQYKKLIADGWYDCPQKASQHAQSEKKKLKKELESEKRSLKSLKKKMKSAEGQKDADDSPANTTSV